MGNGAQPATIGCHHCFNFRSIAWVLANGQSSCEGCYAPHGSDRRFLRDECQVSHGVWGNLDLLRVFPCFRVCVTWRGGIAIDWVTQRSRFWQKHLGLMYSQATVRSYTRDRAVLRWDHTLKRGRL